MSLNSYKNKTEYNKITNAAKEASKQVSPRTPEHKSTKNLNIFVDPGKLGEGNKSGKFSGQ